MCPNPVRNYPYLSLPISHTNCLLLILNLMGFISFPVHETSQKSQAHIPNGIWGLSSVWLLINPVSVGLCSVTFLLSATPCGPLRCTVSSSTRKYMWLIYCYYAYLSSVRCCVLSHLILFRKGVSLFTSRLNRRCSEHLK